MKWNLTKLCSIQQSLDQKIFDKFNLSYIKTFQKRKLALIIELSELANEIRFFKFWSTKPSSDKKIILDEYADVLHFSLTFVIQFNYSPIIDIGNVKKRISDKELTSFFLKLINLAYDIHDKKTISLFLKNFLKVSSYLGFNQKEVLNAYLYKNEINIKRSNTNY